MRLLTLTILLFLTQTLFGQLQTEINNILATKDFLSFKKYADNLSNRQTHIKAYWEVEREIATGFEERILIVEKPVPEKKNPNISTIYTFRVNLLSIDKTILFYDLMERKSKKVNNEWIEYYSTIDTYQNDSLFKKLETTFFKSFGGQFKRQELFTDSIVYGSRCSDGGIDPLEKMYLDNFVATKDKSSLLKWLQSTNVETQLYAIEGFYELKKSGYNIKDNELLFIKNVLKKKGTVRTCSGCIYSREEIKLVAKDFKF
jgi:hypothetical protein